MPKAKMRKWLIVILVLFIIVLFIGYLAISSDLRQTDEEVSESFREKGVQCQIFHLPYRNISIRYITSGLDTKVADVGIMFIHGAPGASDAFYPYQMDTHLMSKASLISIDRLGYGYSDYGNPETSLVEQAKAVQAVMDQVNLDKYIIVSHSYGCPVAAVLSAISSSVIDANIMVSPVIHPEYEKIFFFSPWPSSFPLKYFSSGAMYVAGVEKMSHADELHKVEALWKDLKVPTIIMYGMKDWIAPSENASYLNDKVSPEYLTIDIDSSASHFIIWDQMPEVIAYINQYL